MSRAGKFIPGGGGKNKRPTGPIRAPEPEPAPGSPEAAAGGTLALVRTGDFVILDVPARRLDVDIPNEELAQRSPSEATVNAYATPLRGWERLYVKTVQQANTGADLDFLVGSTGDRVSRESH